MLFHIVDVFGNQPYSGNQLAVFRDIGQLTTGEMQQIAREVNYSETTFISSSVKENGGYNTRIFTPVSEIDFAGHPTLGTAYIIHKFIENGGKGNLTLNLKAGQIPVTFSDQILWMKQNQPSFGSTFTPELMSHVVGLKTADINHHYPIEEVSTGLPFTIIPLTSMNALRRARTDQIQYWKYMENASAGGLLMFSTDVYESDLQLSVRVFVDYLGIPEDPATGSAAGCLAAYLLKHNVFKEQSLTLKAGQGYEIGRPSSIYMNAKLLNEIYDINIGGKVIEIAEGTWR